MSIPEIGFNHKKTNNAEFEVVDLYELYQRRNGLEHSPARPHRVSFFNLIYIEEGSGSHLIDFADYPYDAGSFIFVQKDQVHAFDFTTPPKGKVLLFTQAFLDQVHVNMRLPDYTPTHLNLNHQPVVGLDDALRLSCHSLMAEITNEVTHPESDPLIVMYLFSSLSLMLNRVRHRSHHDNLSRTQNVKFARFFELLRTRFHQERDANWYAAQIHTTYKTLNQVCKLATNQTAKQLIDAYTILEAKRRLVLSHTPTQQLAYDLGFEDASNFVKYFKNHTLLTPTQFQKHYVVPVL